MLFFYAVMMKVLKHVPYMYHTLLVINQISIVFHKTLADCSNHPAGLNFGDH